VRVALLNLLGSNAASQLLIVASTPLLTRVHDQGTFGAFGVATIAALLGATLLSFRLEQSFHVRPDAAKTLLHASLTLIATLSTLVGLPLAALAATRVGIDAFAALVFAAALATTVCVLTYLNLQRRFRTIAALALTTPIVFIGGALLVPEPPGGGNALLFWQAAGYLASALAGLATQRGELAFLGRRVLLRAVGTSRDDLRYLVPSYLLSILSLNMSVAGAAWLFDEQVAGLVVIAQRVARAPVTVLGNSLNEVLRADIPTRTEIPRTFRTIVALCLATSTLMLACVWLVPEEAYALALGSGWEGLRAVLAITVVAACFQLVATSVASLLTAFRKRTDFVVNAALFVAGIIALGTSAALGSDAVGYLWLHSILVALVYTVAFFQCRAVAREQSSN